MKYHFDVSALTIGDSAAIARAAQTNDIYALIEVANLFISIDLFALPISETPIVLQDFAQSFSAAHSSPPNPIDQLIRRALENQP